jgi:hypothetical protein
MAFHLYWLDPERGEGREPGGSREKAGRKQGPENMRWQFGSWPAQYEGVSGQPVQCSASRAAGQGDRCCDASPRGSLDPHILILTPHLPLASLPIGFSRFTPHSLLPLTP